MKLIPLNRDKFAIVDDEDFVFLTQWQWGYAIDNKSGTEYESVKATINGKRRPMSRIIMNPSEELVVDHINGDRLDNRRANLRVCTQSQNAVNSKRSRRKYPGYRGVYLRRDRINPKYPWEAKLTVNRQHLSFGRFPTKEDAAFVYDQVAIQIHGEFSRTNILAYEELNSV